ncbi:hypothetical protein ES705_38353 [subsurface metagenome]
MKSSRKKKQMHCLNKLYDYHLKIDKRKSIRLFYFHHNKYIWLIFILILVLFGLPVLLILLNTLYFKIPFELSITVSLIISIFAFSISIITLLINIIRVMDYPIDNLSIKRLNSEDKFYELQFSVKNCGHGKLKLDFAMYFIEGLNVDDFKNSNINLDRILQDTAITHFLYYKYEKISQYLGELLRRIKNGSIKPFYLQEITKSSGVYFTHDDEHVENRVHKFEDGKLYSITFLFRTTHRVFWYISKHIIT